MWKSEIEQPWTDTLPRNGSEGDHRCQRWFRTGALNCDVSDSLEATNEIVHEITKDETKVPLYFIVFTGSVLIKLLLLFLTVSPKDVC